MLSIAFSSWSCYDCCSSYHHIYVQGRNSREKCATSILPFYQESPRLPTILSTLPMMKLNRLCLWPMLGPKTAGKVTIPFFQLLGWGRQRNWWSFPHPIRLIPFHLIHSSLKKYHGNLQGLSSLLLPEKVEDQPYKQAIVQIRKLAEMFSVVTVFIRALLFL